MSNASRQFYIELLAEASPTTISTTPVIPSPTLPRHDPRFTSECEAALRKAVQEIVEKATKAGWPAETIGAALSTMACDHLADEIREAALQSACGSTH